MQELVEKISQTFLSQADVIQPPVEEDEMRKQKIYNSITFD